MLATGAVTLMGVHVKSIKSPMRLALVQVRKSENALNTPFQVLFSQLFALYDVRECKYCRHTGNWHVSLRERMKLGAAPRLGIFNCESYSDIF